MVETISGEVVRLFPSEGVLGVETISGEVVRLFPSEGIIGVGTIPEQVVRLLRRGRKVVGIHGRRSRGLETRMQMGDG